MKDVNAYCYFQYSLLKKIQYTGYEIIDSVYTHYGDCTIFCKPYTRDMIVCIKASYVDDEYWNVTTGKFEHASGYSFYARLGNDEQKCIEQGIIEFKTEEEFNKIFYPSGKVEE